MDIFISILLIIVGIALLVVGANFFVDGASGIAAKLKVSAFVIGMTVVAFGTSAPELAVSISSAVTGNGDITMGNAVGSNIINILLILGLSACIRPLAVNKKTSMIEIPFLVLISALLILFTELGGNSPDIAGIITRPEGGILIALLVVYIVYMVLMGMSERKRAKNQPDGLIVADGVAVAGSSTGGDVEKSTARPNGEATERKGLFGIYDKLKTHVWFLIIITIVGLAGVVFGANLVVDNVDKLTAMMPEGDWKKIISITVVALGTSLPELVTSVIAAIKGNTDLALGNIIGSNIFNILLILGLPALISTVTFASGYLIDIIISLSAALLLLFCVLIGRGNKINRVGGVIMLLSLCGYLTYLFLSA